MRVPAQHCGRLHSRVACQNAMDPYCGWNELKEQCTPAPNHDPLSNYWKQSVTQCPVLTDPGECFSTQEARHHSVLPMLRTEISSGGENKLQKFVTMVH